MTDLPFNERLRIAIWNECINQRELAKCSEIDEANISHYLSGERKPGLDNIQAILRALPNTDARWLLGGYA
ncbi:helix-turn-helix domain-containing protein [Burkholderia cenocepacia]|uniref:helix-turn-helix domain-containing protein n=1 Tax=Burkholderia cenocepacia TaxID=95486 RepID=UPI00285F7B2C|nr:helix-turn-helix transcriptional regulator [Burkholderia cenocepacia]MDR8102494.1 helix-turn-helix domain-containing protein [Burkholderia cenocepacia]